MIKTLKNKKKKGFTLIELVAVIAIIGILAAVLIPRVVGYINDAKQGAVVQQAKNVLHAYNTYNAKETSSLPDTTTISALETKVKATGAVDYSEYFNTDLTKEANRINNGRSMADLNQLVKSGAFDDANKNGNLDDNETIK